jgi:RNA polymerase sigma-70 factor (ECF subfamily)
MSGSPIQSNSLAALARAGVHQPHRFSVIEQEVIELFDGLRDPLLRYLLGFSPDISDAEDILQETFLALFQHLHRGKSREHLRGWLFRVAHNLALKHQRAQRVAKNVPESLIAAFDSAICPAPSPEALAMKAQAHKRVAAVFEALPEQHRWCLYLRAEGLRYREIAEILNMSLGSVSACLERSLSLIARAHER